MALRKQKVDPFGTISEKEILWQEIPEAAKDAVKGDEKEVLTWRDSRASSAEEIRQSWENHRAQKRIGPTRVEQ